MTVRGGAGASAENFEAVLAAAKQGAGWASTTIWTQYAPAVAAFLTARGSAEPDDLTSEVFLAVFDSLPTFSGDEAQFRSFIFSIAYRRLVDELRRRSRRGATEEWVDENDPRRAPSAEREAERRLGDQRALSVLDSLPVDQRNVMVLRIIADLTIEQIAVVLDKREGAVKALQRRALESLRKKSLSGRTPAAPLER